MGHTKQQLLGYLKEHGISFESYEHPVVLTVEAQAKHIGHMEGGHSKNLFLKRLGLGKGGLRMAPEEALKDVLQVHLGCVTPFALYNESARSVALLLDKGFKAQKRVFFHPLSNDMTISLATDDLDKFLMSINKEPAYVDLEATVPVGKDQLPDLAVHVPTEVIILSNILQQEVTNDIGSLNISERESEMSKLKEKANSKPKTIAKVNNDKKGTNIVGSTASVTNVGNLVNSIIDTASATILSEITEDAVKLHEKDLGHVVAGAVRKRLGPELESLLMLLKMQHTHKDLLQGLQVDLCLDEFFPILYRPCLLRQHQTISIQCPYEHFLFIAGLQLFGYAQWPVFEGGGFKICFKADR